MRKGMYAAALLLLSQGSPVGAQDGDNIEYGNGLLAACERPVGSLGFGMCLGFTNGVASAYQYAGLICFPPHVTYGQIQDVATNALRANPAERQTTSNTLLYKYLVAAFPCPKRN